MSLKPTNKFAEGASAVWDFSTDAVAGLWENKKAIGQTLGVAALVGGILYLGSKGLSCTTNAFGYVRDSMAEVGHTIDDNFSTGRNPKALYSPFHTEEKYGNGDLEVDFENGRLEIDYTGPNGGKYDILDSDGVWNEPEDIKYTPKGGETYTPKDNVGESHRKVREAALNIYDYVTDNADLEFDGPK